MADIKQAIEFAKQNPNSDFSVELRKRIESGKMSVELETAGLSMPQAPQPQQQGITETVKPTLGIGQQQGIGLNVPTVGGGEIVGDFFSNLTNSFKERGERVVESFKQTESIGKPEEGEITPPEFGLGVAGEVAGGATDILGELFIGGIKGAGKLLSALTPDALEDPIIGKAKEFGTDFLESDIGKSAIEAIKQGSESFDKWKTENPRKFRAFSAFGNIVDLVLETKAVSKGTELFEEPVEQAIKKGDDITKKVVKKGEDVLESKRLKGVSKAEEAIQETISPKLTAKETRKIIDEGRVVRDKRGKLSETIFGKRPDIVTQSDQVVDASKTINKLIPDANKLDDFALNDAMKSEIGKISTELTPQMKVVSLADNTADDAFKIWDDLKISQAKEPEFAAFAGSKRAQSNFEGFLGEIRESENLDDLWDIRKRYDRSIKSGVKEASVESAPSLQLQKDMWLDNRAILNDVINDTANGLGETSQKAFADMSKLYMARQNIKMKAKILTEKAGGVFNKKNLIRFGVGAGLGKFLLFD